MKRVDSNMVKHFAQRLFMILAVVAMAFASACSDDGGTSNGGGTTHNFTEGVVMPSQTVLSRNAMAATITLTIITESGYTIDIDNSSMASISTGGTGTKGGTHKVTMAIAENSGKQARSCNLFIQVDGHQRVKLYEIQQEANNLSEEVEWIDQSLQDDYYWLDEYVEKRGTFDFSLAYDKFLSSSLLSLSTNGDDGGVDADGDRYIFSYVDRKENSTRSDVFADSRTVKGYGIELASTVWVMNDEQTEVGFAVSHVYPESPAAQAGVLRGDVITKIDGKTIMANNWNEVNRLWTEVYYGNTAIKITIDGSDAEGNPVLEEHELVAAEYENTPIAYAGVLDIDEKLNPNGRKVGYLAYLSFIDIFTADLVTAIEDLGKEGITDIILDLRSNSGGVANLSNVLTSALIDQSYEGKLFAKYIFNPKSKRYPSPNNERSISMASTYIDPATNAQKSLPHLAMKKVWIISDEYSASCSESVIVGLQGLDIEVVQIGGTTRGKNCGMTVTWETFGDYEYELAPITFIHANAKGFSDYGDGLKPDVDINSFATDPSLSSALQYHCRAFPMPMTEWGDYSYDIALAEAINRICKGVSLLDKSYSGDEASFFKGAELTTRSGAAAPLRKLNRELRNPNPSLRERGMYITEEELQAIEKTY